MGYFVSQLSSKEAPEPAPGVSPTPETHESQILFTQAQEYLSRNRTRDAMKVLEEAIQISPRNGAYLSHYGLAVALELEDYASATKLCERAVKLDPRNPVNRVNLGRVYRLAGEKAMAHDQFIEAWHVDHTHPAPAAELSRMGVRRRPVLPFLPRGHWLNVSLGKLRARVWRSHLVTR